MRCACSTELHATSCALKERLQQADRSKRLGIMFCNRDVRAVSHMYSRAGMRRDQGTAFGCIKRIAHIAGADGRGHPLQRRRGNITSAG